MALLQPVDRVEIVVLIDNRTDSLSSVPPNATLEWANLRSAGMTELNGSCQCCANHGLALIIRAHRGANRRTVLFDAGPTDIAVEFNGRRLGTRFGEIDAVVLSHGHWDHAGGLPGALQLIVQQGRRSNIPCYLHPGMFRQRALPLPDGRLLPIRTIPTPEELRSAGGTPVITDKPQVLLDDMFFLSGEIPRVTSYEKGFPGHMRRAADGETWEPDPLILDERYLAIHIAGKGLVVFSACSHAGIVNVLCSARANFSGVPLHVVAGGFHLSGQNEAIINPTVTNLRQFGFEWIIPGHCTGWRAVAALERSFGEKVVPMAVGMTFNLSSL